MLFDYIAHDPYVQAVIVAGVAGCYCVTLIKRYLWRESEATRQETRAMAALKSRVSEPGQSLSTVEN